MSELSAKIAALKGDRTTEEIVKTAGISRETFRRLERGDTVKFATLRGIAETCGASPDDWVELIIAWIKAEVGAEAAQLWIEPRIVTPSKLRDQPESVTSRAMMLFNELNAEDRQQIILAMERPEVRRCLPALNKLYDSLRRA